VNERFLASLEMTSDRHPASLKINKSSIFNCLRVRIRIDRIA
jgi:hypothetical protein